MKKVVVFTGAGISAESGLKTFRDSGGLWEEYDISEVATPEAWMKDPEKVNTFYNKRRKQVIEAEPNKAHQALVNLEEHFDVQIITQNIDDLHERAGSTKILHLHGEIRKARSTRDESLIYAIDGWELDREKVCEKGSPLRPHVVWFGEPVPMMQSAAALMSEADIVIVIGTSLNVYPAAGLIHHARQGSSIFLIDPRAEEVPGLEVTVIREPAGKAVPELVSSLTPLVK